MPAGSVCEFSSSQVILQSDGLLAPLGRCDWFLPVCFPCIAPFLLRGKIAAEAVRAISIFSSLIRFLCCLFIAREFFFCFPFFAASSGHVPLTLTPLRPSSWSTVFFYIRSRFRLPERAVRLSLPSFPFPCCFSSFDLPVEDGFEHAVSEILVLPPCKNFSPELLASHRLIFFLLGFLSFPGSRSFCPFPGRPPE